MGERIEELRQLEAASRCLVAGLTHADMKTMAALLRAAAKYLDGASGRVGRPAVVAMSTRAQR